MSRYKVRWSLDVDATSPKEAVLKARKMQLTGSIHDMGYFRVYDEGHQIKNGKFDEVDLVDIWEEGELEDPPSIEYGCHVDIKHGADPYPDCVLQEDKIDDCTHAVDLSERDQLQHKCKYWKPLNNVEDRANYFKEGAKQ